MHIGQRNKAKCAGVIRLLQQQEERVQQFDAGVIIMLT